jgi:hypothetical protein
MPTQPPTNKYWGGGGSFHGAKCDRSLASAFQKSDKIITGLYEIMHPSKENLTDQF